MGVDLPPAEMAKWAEGQLMRMAQQNVKPVELTEEQLRVIGDLCAEIAKDGHVERYWAKVQQKVEELLTDEQKTAIAKSMAVRMVKSNLAQAGLTDEQARQVEADFDEVVKEFEGTDPRTQFSQLLVKLQEKTRAQLTDEQKGRIVKSQVMGTIRLSFFRAALTQDQLQQAEAECEACLKDGTLNAEGLVKKVGDRLSALLTDEQEEAMKKPNPYQGTPVGSGLYVPDER
jgi:hypothetical protein